MAPDQWFGVLTGYRKSFHSETPATSRSRTDAGKSRCIFLRRDKSKQLSVFRLSKIAVVNVRLRVCGS
jgi:hypothetical protein